MNHNLAPNGLGKAGEQEVNDNYLKLMQALKDVEFLGEKKTKVEEKQAESVSDFLPRGDSGSQGKIGIRYREGTWPRIFNTGKT